MFKEAIKNIKIGDKIRLTCRGNYGDFVDEGTLVKVEDGYLYLDHGFAHSYKRIIRIIAGGKRYE